MVTALAASAQDIEAKTDNEKHGPAVTASRDAKNHVPSNKSSRDSAFAKLGIAKPYKGKLTSLSEVNIRDALLQRVLPPIPYPWAFEFISDNEILLTQNNGTLLQIDLPTGKRFPIRGLPDIGGGFAQIGLMDVALHPDFSSNRRIYLSFAKPRPSASQYHMTEVATGILRGDQLLEVQTLINGDHYGWAPSNFGGALAFDDENHLYISIGDRGNDPLSQHEGRLEGKILRLRDDGSTPEDNPFYDRDGFDPRVYAMGVRNAQGLFFDRHTQQLLEVEHGPLGGDELNVIEAGKNYGWPQISYGSNYATIEPIGAGTHEAGMVQPVFYFLPSIATSKLLLYRGDMFPEWNGDIFVAALKGRQIVKLDYDMGVVRSSHSILTEVRGRIRDIKEAPDGSIYILSQTSGLHRVYRDTEKEALSSAARPAEKQLQEASASAADSANESSAADARGEPHPGQQLYDLVCSGCHDTGAMDAPVLGNREQWMSILAQPIDLTRDHVMNGYNDMPERGLCYTCSESQLMQIVDYMFEESAR